MKFFFLIFLSLFVCSGLSAQQFDLVPLGVLGGEHEDNLSSYLLSVHGDDRYLCLDAGTINAGLRKAIMTKSLKGGQEDLLKNNIKGYFISHGHLDHLAGLVMNSPADAPKNIYAIAPVIEIFKSHYFISSTWANFADSGEQPAINKYHYVPLTPKTPVPVENTPFRLTAYELSHVNPYLSSAALVSAGENYILYLGDTGADRIERSEKLGELWHAVAPLIRSGNLKTIMIEVSFPNKQPEKLLFGHLTPALLNEELAKLAAALGTSSLKGVTVVVTHRKPPIQNVKLISEELLNKNPLQVNYVFPEQGRKIVLP